MSEGTDGEMEIEVEKIKRHLGGKPSNGAVAQHLPKHLVGPFWRRALDRYFDGALRGYKKGTTLPPDIPPWDLGWEQDPQIDDGHAHDWEVVHLLADGQRRAFDEDVVRCAVCHCPRCGYSTDEDPCMERRHHRDLHIYLSGEFAPLGGILREESA